MNKIVYCVYGDNHTVTDFYMDIIAEAFKHLGYNVHNVSFEDTNLDKTVPTIVPSAMDLFLWYRKGFRNFVMWNQGTIPEESYMRRKSRIKWAVLSILEWWGLKRAMVNLFVSEAQKLHFEKQYHISFAHSYVMPCYNCELDESVFETKGKYENNIFAYTGSFTAPWQYIHGNLSFYKKIEDRFGAKVFLKILTPHQDVAKKKMEEYGIKHYSIGCVPPEELPCAIADAKFGLLLREDNIVNNIATPTKLSSYMSCGLIPIVSSCIKDYSKHMKGEECFVLVDNNLNAEGLDHLIETPTDFNVVRDSFMRYWDAQYNTSKHINNIKDKLKEAGF